LNGDLDVDAEHAARIAAEISVARVDRAVDLAWNAGNVQ
jgi:hypothetical protein